ncbi:MAG TPA: adenosylcobinamide-GDP ribazoletransferase [Candidatus Binataceae bacterium]|nr:adenosylcobinamide-GDP ribazoletransferase [Candidatus Binataceae bacterium]
MSDIESDGRSGIFTELRLAISFLTIVPVIDEQPTSEAAVARSFAWFPIVGFMIGAALCAEDKLLASIFGQTIRSVLIVLSLTILTGAIHLDGLADTADALGAGWNRERALEILRDSRVGTFGVAAIFFDLSLKVLALATLAGRHRMLALFMAPGISRMSMVIVADSIEYLRTTGAGTALVGGDETRRLMRACVTVAAVLCLTLSIRGLGATVIAMAAALMMRSFYRRWLGGVTGDLIGACGEIAEIAVLITFAS